jgi:folate-binding protein YgfZ
METPLRSRHEALSARLGTWFGVTLPSAYEAPDREYSRGRKFVVLFDTNYHAIFELAGPDRGRYLNAVTSGDIKSLVAGQGTPGLLLNPQGHILAELETFAREDRFVLLSHASVAQRTFETLDKFIIMDDCTLTDVSAQWATCALEGPRAAEALRAASGVELDSLPPFGHQAATIAGVACRVIRRSHFDLPGVEVLAPRESIAAVWQPLLAAAKAAEGGPIGWEAINALRIEAGVRWFGYDFDDSVIPQEAGIETTHISYTKGCYTGQEIVERVRSRGRLNRWLSLLEFSGDMVPERGAKLTAEEKAWGEVTSAALSPAMKGVIGFGYLRKEHNTVGAELQCGAQMVRVGESPAAVAKNAYRPACA